MLLLMYKILKVPQINFLVLLLIGIKRTRI